MLFTRHVMLKEPEDYLADPRLPERARVLLTALGLTEVLVACIKVLSGGYRRWNTNRRTVLWK